MSGDPLKKSTPKSIFKLLNLKPRIVGVISMLGVCVIAVLVALSSVSGPINQTNKLTLPSRQATLQKEHFIKDFRDRPLLAPTINLTRKGSTKSKPSYVPLSTIPKHDLLAKKVSKTNVSAKLAKYKKVSLKKVQKVRITTKGPTLERQLSAIKQARESRLNKLPVIVDSVLATPVPKARKVITKTISVRKINKTRLKGHVGRGYGMQFVASKKKSALKKYARKYKIYNKAKYYETKSKGKKWYVLVVGDYSTKAAAKRAEAHLPRLLKNKKPWLRSIKGLKRSY